MDIGVNSPFKKLKKNLMWSSHNFLLLCIILEENFVISPGFKFKLCFVRSAIE